MGVKETERDIILIDPHSNLVDKNNIPNIGLGSIESYLNHHGVDCLRINISEIADYIDASQVFGVSVMDHTYTAARAVTQRLHNKTVIWGGWTATALPEFLLKENPDIDYIILQEGEKRLLNLLRSFHQPEVFDEIDGIAYRNEKHEILIRPAVEFLDIDELPIPTNPVQRELVYVEIARGCYGKCRYCPEVHKMRFKSAKRAAEEIRHWHTRGYTYFYLGGANSIANGSLLRALVREMEERELHIKILLVGRPSDVLRNHDILKETFTSPIISLHSIEVGVEANSQRLLDLLGRGATPEINRKAIASLLELKAKYSPHTNIHANMILFSHFDMTIEDFVENVRFIGDYRCSRESMALQLYGVASTLIWDEMKARGFKPQTHQGLQIVDYLFSDKDVDRLFQRLVYKPLQKIKNKKTFSFTDHREFQHQCHDKLLEFYHSPDITKSVMDFINASDDDI